MAESAPLKWSALDGDVEERGKDWYVALGIAAVAIAIIAVLFNDALFGILVIVAAITLALIARHPSSMVEFEISDRGIRVGETLHRYEEIVSFWVDDENANSPLLLVDTVKFLSPNLIIPIQHVDAASVRAFLLEHADEVRMREPIAHKILAFVGL